MAWHEMMLSPLNKSVINDEIHLYCLYPSVKLKRMDVLKVVIPFARCYRLQPTKSLTFFQICKIQSVFTGTALLLEVLNDKP